MIKTVAQATTPGVGGIDTTTTDQNSIQQSEDQLKQLKQDELDLKKEQLQLIQEQIQKLQQQLTANKKSASHMLPEKSNTKIAFKDIEIECDVAATPRQQASGLQPYKELPYNRGLWFPFVARRTATFHMGDVKFPIDMIFIDNNKISKIVENIQPRQMGSWSSTCTDVIEVNGGWCSENNVRVGDIVRTPLVGKKRAQKDIEKLLNTSWSAPQDARITSNVEGSGNSYDMLRTITTAEDNDTVGFSPEEEAEILNVFPFLKSAQEHRQPDTTDRRQPGEIDKRDPSSRFEHHTLPDEFDPFGDGDDRNIDPFDNPNLPSSTGDGKSNYGKHYHLQRGYDPAVFRESDHPYAIRPSAQVVKVDSPSPDTELAGIDKYKLASGSVRLFEQYGPDWQDYLPEDFEVKEGRNYDKIAIVNDNMISSWIDTLGFDSENEAKLRKSMFTDEFKELLGDSLIASNNAVDYEIFDSDLLLYK